MKIVFFCVLALLVTQALCQPVQAQLDLERQIEMILLYQSGEGEKYDKKAKLEELGRNDEMQNILLRMVADHQHSKAGTKEYLYLIGSTAMLGEMRVKRAVNLLSRILIDHRVDASIRAFATRSLGQIDVHENKKLLIRQLTDKSNDHLIRVLAAEALAQTKDLKVLRILERCISEERDSHVREKFSRAAQALKGNLER